MGVQLGFMGVQLGFKVLRASSRGRGPRGEDFRGLLAAVTQDRQDAPETGRPAGGFRGLR